MFPWDGRDENRKSCEGLIQVYSRDSSLEYIEDFGNVDQEKSHSLLIAIPFSFWNLLEPLKIS